MLNNLRAIYVFVKTVELGSFRAAARALDLSPSVVSYHVSQLEAELDLALLYRSTRKLSLTSEGRELFERVQATIESTEQAVEQLLEKASEPVGQLRITVPAAITRHRLIDAIAAFALQFPGIRLDLNFSDQPRDLIEHGIDIALRTGNIPATGLRQRRIAVLERCLVAAPEYVAARPAVATPRDLGEWNWVRFSMLKAGRRFTHTDGKQVSIKYESRIMVDSIDALCRFVVAGLGLATPPKFLVSGELRTRQLVEVLPSWRLDPLVITALWPANSPRQGLTSRFVEFLVKSEQRAEPA